MHIKGCDNAKAWSTKEEDKAYRDNYIRIFGEKKEFNIGKQVYDDVTGKWVDADSYVKPVKERKGFLIRTKSHLNAPEIEYIGKDTYRKEKMSGYVYK
jgi:hypothetical protein